MKTAQCIFALSLLLVVWHTASSQEYKVVTAAEGDRYRLYKSSKLSPKGYFRMSGRLTLDVISQMYSNSSIDENPAMADRGMEFALPFSIMFLISRFGVHFQYQMEREKEVFEHAGYRRDETRTESLFEHRLDVAPLYRIFFSSTEIISYDTMLVSSRSDGLGGIRKSYLVKEGRRTIGHQLAVGPYYSTYLNPGNGEEVRNYQATPVRVFSKESYGIMADYVLKINYMSELLNLNSLCLRLHPEYDFDGTSSGLMGSALAGFSGNWYILAGVERHRYYIGMANWRSIIDIGIEF